ncbi:MAG: hypothetical protein OEY97_03265 [Nitrospirota bacterium]|nr:hypothetical protein [Nitrospirota bacterium]
MTIRTHIVTLGASLALLAGLSGCATDIVDLDGQDRDAFFPTLRATVPMSGGGGEWEFGVSQGSGSFSNDVPPGSTVDFGGLNTGGSADTVTTDIDLRVWQATLSTASYDGNTPPGMAGGVMVGFNWVEMDVTLNTASPGGPTYWDDGTGQFLLGMQMGVIPRSGILGWRGRMVGGVGGHSNLITFFGEGELIGVARFTPNAEAFAGWRWWSYSYLHSDFLSELDTQISGPTLGLNIRY